MTRRNREASATNDALLAGEVHSHLKALGTWVDPSDGQDVLIAGDPATRVSGIAVAWQAQWSALRRAHELGCNVFITHEPTYPEAWEGHDRPWDVLTAAKQHWLEQAGLVVYRCHETLDTLPVHGVLDSWVRALGFEGCRVPFTAPWIVPAGYPRMERYFAFLDLKPTHVGELAQHVIHRLAPEGQSSVLILGDVTASVRYLGVGTGAVTPPIEMAAMTDEVGNQPNALIVVEDGFRYWNEGAWALDHGVPLIVVSHGVAEEFGMKSLAAYLHRQFPDVPVHHIPQGRQYQSVDTTTPHTQIRRR